MNEHHFTLVNAILEIKRNEVSNHIVAHSITRQ